MNTSTTIDLLTAARLSHSGVGAFNVVLLEHAEGIVAGAENVGLPVILQISENCIRYHGDLAPIVLATLRIARAASVPVTVHLDHIESGALVRQGLALGVDSVMFDASKLPYNENVATTREIVAACHSFGVPVEAELGEVGGKDGVHAFGVRTDPDDAVRFVDQTGVDSLAVAVGSSHAMTTRVASVDLDLIRRLSSAVPVPLVLHGSSGLPDDQLVAAIAAGMTKINISTHLNGLFTGAVRAVLQEKPLETDPRTFVTAGRAALSAEVGRLLRLING
ncbi:class II fructose-bisphosphate aldolase [Subtercola lobariae]|uniref:class II fructose-bisphosphate aldolase n=1 Tax=Subtercola lobariae TaxID=1588641 RepID=UPI0016687DE4|nr:class II fructose-bisphosphate aldolase [Subtercola lobariae]